MKQVIYSPHAEEDLREIWRYIANDNPVAADNVAHEIREKLELYLTLPKMGKRRDSIAPGLRSFSVGKYLVFYREVEGGIQCVRIVHGMRDIDVLRHTLRPPESPN